MIECCELATSVTDECEEAFIHSELSSVTNCMYKKSELMIMRRQGRS